MPEEKINPVAKEATAPKAKPNPDKIKASQEKVAERKAEDKSKIPTLSDMVASMKKQTNKKMKAEGSTFKRSIKNNSFPK